MDWDTIPKGTKCHKKDWVTYTNKRVMSGLLTGWDGEDVYLLMTRPGDKPSMMAMRVDEAAAICRILSTAVMTFLWERDGDEYRSSEGG